MSDRQMLLCEKRSYSREITSHQHDYGQFLFALQGTLEIVTNEKSLHLAPDSCFYLPPGMVHEYHSRDRNEFLILDIPTSFLQRDLESTYMALDQRWKSIRSLLLEETQHKSKGLQDLTRYLIGQMHTRMAPSIAYLHKHYKESIPLETLAELEHYHPSYFSSWFKQKTGKSPKAYVNELRLKEAKQLLDYTSWSITQIGEEVGFQNTSSFTRWFNRQEGLSPQCYRHLKNGQLEP